MEVGVILNTDDVKKIIAAYFHVDESRVIKSRYSYTVIGAKETDMPGGDSGDTK